MNFGDKLGYIFTFVVACVLLSFANNALKSHNHLRGILSANQTALGTNFNSAISDTDTIYKALKWFQIIQAILVAVYGLVVVYILLGWAFGGSEND